MLKIRLALAGAAFVATACGGGNDPAGSGTGAGVGAGLGAGVGTPTDVGTVTDVGTATGVATGAAIEAATAEFPASIPSSDLATILARVRDVGGSGPAPRYVASISLDEKLTSRESMEATASVERLLETGEARAIGEGDHLLLVLRRWLPGCDVPSPDGPYAPPDRVAGSPGWSAGLDDIDFDARVGRAGEYRSIDYVPVDAGEVLLLSAPQGSLAELVDDHSPIGLEDNRADDEDGFYGADVVGPVPASGVTLDVPGAEAPALAAVALPDQLPVGGVRVEGGEGDGDVARLGSGGVLRWTPGGTGSTMRLTLGTDIDPADASTNPFDDRPPRRAVCTFPDTGEYVVPAEAAAVLGESDGVPGARLMRIDLATERRGETLIVTGRSDSVRVGG